MTVPLLHSRTLAQVDKLSVAINSSYIFHGPRSSGKMTTAMWLAERLACDGDGGDNCSVCRQIESANYPDLIIVAPEDKPSVTIEQIRRLFTTLALSPYRADGTRLVLIDQAEMLTTEAQNALLKNLEEPPSRTQFILVTSALESLLPTVRSRLATVYFAPVASADIADFLQQRSNVRPVDAAALAELSDGLVGEAVRLSDLPEAATARTELDHAASQLLHPNRFTRLIAARRLADNKQPMTDLLSLLQRRVVASLVDGQAAAEVRRQIAALVSARRLLAAGVVSRVVLDRLTVEL
ncbi:hypothetical protein HJC99_02825 [Candidatus Saccharibacteria bacterium]|nr:hypothetical protein [Candidatus Saccharibacteria bacterium]